MAEKQREFVTEKETHISVTHGYARCSTDESRQDIDRQARELKAAGATQIWLEYEHGDTPSKKVQKAMFDAASPGDSIITTEVPRLCRSTRQLCDIIDLVQQKSLRIQILGSITLDCRNNNPDPMTVAFLQIAGVFAQLELSMIRVRVKSGMVNAKAKGKQLGRPQLQRKDIPDAFFDILICIKPRKSTSLNWHGSAASADPQFIVICLLLVIKVRLFLFFGIFCRENNKNRTCFGGR